MSMKYEDPMSRLLYSPMPSRPAITWPDGSRVALWICVNVEHYELVPPRNSFYNTYNRIEPPDVQQYSYREYGNRVGFWRLLDLLDEFNIRPTVSLNVGVLEMYPEVAQAMVSRDWDFLSHGLFNTRPIFGYAEDEERRFFRETCDMFFRCAGRPLRGLLGPAVSVTPRTFDLMTEFGLTYTADFFHDDHPTPVLTNSGRLISIPYTVDLNDGNLAASGALHVFPERAAAQLRRLWREGSDSGRVMCLSLHPYIAGQPSAIGHVRKILEDIKSFDSLWMATAGEIVEYYSDNCYEQELQYELSLLPDEVWRSQ
jgi:allantoinase